MERGEWCCPFASHRVGGRSAVNLSAHKTPGGYPGVVMISSGFAGLWMLIALLPRGDEEALAEQFDAVLAEGRKWVSAQTRGNWEEDPSAPELPTAGSVYRELIGFGKWRKSPERAKRT